MNNTDMSMTDREMISDSLSSQKFVTANYNYIANECNDNNLRTTVLDLLREEHDIQYEIYNEMNKRGWYPTKPANQNDVEMAKQKFSSMQQ